MRLTVLAIALTVTCSLAESPDQKTEKRVADSKSKTSKAKKGKEGDSKLGEKFQMRVTQKRKSQAAAGTSEPQPCRYRRPRPMRSSPTEHQ